MKLPKNSKFAAVFGLMLLSTSAIAAPDMSCLTPALDAELRSKFQYIDDLTAMISQNRPDLAESVVIQAASGKANFEYRWSRVVWLLEVAPERMTTPADIWAITWSDEDQLAWQTASPDHEMLQDEFDSKNASLKDMPNRDDFLDFMATTRQDTDYIKLAEQFGIQNSALRDAVADCY